MRRRQAGRYRRVVASNLDCVGLAVRDREAMRRLIASALDTAELIGRRGERCLYRWQDPSGARLLVTTEGGTIVDFLPSYGAEPGARLANVRAGPQAPRQLPRLDVEPGGRRLRDSGR